MVALIVPHPSQCGLPAEMNNAAPHTFSADACLQKCFLLHSNKWEHHKFASSWLGSRTPSSSCFRALCQRVTDGLFPQRHATVYVTENIIITELAEQEMTGASMSQSDVCKHIMRSHQLRHSQRHHHSGGADPEANGDWAGSSQTQSASTYHVMMLTSTLTWTSQRILPFSWLKMKRIDLSYRVGQK